MTLVSVIVIERNVRKYIKNCLDSLLAQSYRNVEIIVCDGNSTDGTKEIIREEYVPKGVKLLVDEGKGPGIATNLAIKHSRGEILCFTFGDEEPTTTWIENIVRHFEDPSVLGVFGPAFFKKESGLLTKFAQYKLKNRWIRRKYIDSKHIANTNCAYRRTVINKVGYFREDMVDAYDSEFSYRVFCGGCKIVYDPKAIVYHQAGHEESLITYLTAIMNVNFGYGQAIYIHGIRFAPEIFLLSVVTLGHMLFLLILCLLKFNLFIYMILLEFVALAGYSIFKCFHARTFIALFNLFFIPFRLIVGSFSLFLGAMYQLFKMRSYSSLALMIRKIFDFTRLKWD
ncbi:MAG: glycosyltransferase [Nitrososphaeria archaeon]